MGANTAFVRTCKSRWFSSESSLRTNMKAPRSFFIVLLTKRCVSYSIIYGFTFGIHSSYVQINLFVCLHFELSSTCAVPNSNVSPVSSKGSPSPSDLGGKRSTQSKRGKKIGVYTLKAGSIHDASSKLQDLELAEIQEICLHNAHVSAHFGETGKSQTWELLAKALESGYSTARTAHNSWGGHGGAALSENLVGNIFRYYESLGDVQMLSTMVSVLRSTSGQAAGALASNNNTGGVVPMRCWSLLPAGQDNNKYDNYIRRYAELLYAWGLFLERAELNKHLVQAALECGERVDMDASEAGPSILTRTSSTACIAYSFTCPTCFNDTLPGSNFCSTCQDYAFRCIICDTAVRGLFSSCER